MDFYIGLAQVIGVHSLLGLSAWSLLHTGQVSLAQGVADALQRVSQGLIVDLAVEGFELIGENQIMRCLRA